MDDIVIIMIKGKEYRFKLGSRSILYLEKFLGQNIFEAFQNPGFTTMVTLFYATLDPVFKGQFKDAADLFDQLLEEYDFQTLAETYLTQIIEKSGLVAKARAKAEEASPEETPSESPLVEQEEKPKEWAQ